MPTSERPVEQKIIIAVDFGTTYSGIAWAQTGEADAQNIVQHWPDKNTTSGDFHGRSVDKVPTTLRYGQHGIRWGYQIEKSDKRYEWFKLGLDPSMQRNTSRLAGRYPGSSQLPMQLSSDNATSPTKLVTDYLTALHDHAEYMLQESLTEVVLKRTPREYVISVPAVWTDKARDLTTTCAVDAGMGPASKLHIVSEPEVAAMYTFKEMNSCGLKKGDTFVVCDAGGGTVDLISYTVLSLSPILELAEASPGSGSACGSIFLNRIFAETLNKRFKHDQDWKDDREIFDTAMEHFDTTTKISFNGKQSETVPVHGLSPQHGIRKGKLTLSIPELEDVFEPVISEILALIKTQIHQTAKQVKLKVKLILLVGGFGSSFYLKSRIQETFGSDIQVKMGTNCQTAVVRGALMKGLADVKGGTNKLPHIRVDLRKARKHYGTECYTDYRPRSKFPVDGHSPERRERSSFTGKDSVKFMRWFLKRGEAVKESEPATFCFSTDKMVAAGLPKDFSIDIFYCDDLKDNGAPAHRTHDVERLGTVKGDIGGVDGVDPSLLRKEKGNDGQEYYKMDFDIEMRCYGARLEFTPVFHCKGGGRLRLKSAKMAFD